MGVKKTSHGSLVELINGRKQETEQREKKKEKGTKIRKCCARLLCLSSFNQIISSSLVQL